MEKHTLFMLTPWMEEEAGPFYCPDCGVVEGFFYYSPKVREVIDIVHVDFPRPRNQIVEMLESCLYDSLNITDSFPWV